VLKNNIKNKMESYLDYEQLTKVTQQNLDEGVWDAE